MFYIYVPKIATLPFTFYDKRITPDLFVGIDSIEHDDAIDHAWVVDTYDGYLTIKGEILRPTAVRFKLDYSPFTGLTTLIK